MPDKRTYADRREYIIAAVTKKRRLLKLRVIKYKGGKCSLCGYCRYQGALDLHHAVGEKEFGMGHRGYSKSWNVIKREIDKCVLLCANCHREVEAGMVKLPHGYKTRNYLQDAIK